LTDWPPGPDEREKRQVSSSSGMTTDPRTRRSPGTGHILVHGVFIHANTRLRGHLPAPRRMLGPAGSPAQPGAPHLSGAGLLVALVTDERSSV